MRKRSTLMFLQTLFRLLFIQTLRNSNAEDQKQQYSEFRSKRLDQIRLKDSVSVYMFVLFAWKQ